jgi:hypothetical protein
MQFNFQVLKFLSKDIGNFLRAELPSLDFFIYGRKHKTAHEPNPCSTASKWRLSEDGRSLGVTLTTEMKTVVFQGWLENDIIAFHIPADVKISPEILRELKAVEMLCIEDNFDLETGEISPFTLQMKLPEGKNLIHIFDEKYTSRNYATTNAGLDMSISFNPSQLIEAMHQRYPQNVRIMQLCKTNIRQTAA